MRVHSNPEILELQLGALPWLRCLRGGHRGLLGRQGLPCLCLLVLLGVWSHALSPVAATPLEKPNILLIMTDDQRAESIACMSNLQQLIARPGVTFTRAYASTPLCCPGRSSVLTGLFAHNHGVRSNKRSEYNGSATRFRLEGNESNVVAKFVQAHGYLTGYFGKYLNGSRASVLRKYVPPFWDEWHVIGDHALFYDFLLLERGQDYPTPTRVCYLRQEHTAPRCTTPADHIVRGPEHHFDDVHREKVLRFMDRALAEHKPFFAIYAPAAPHGPYAAPDRYQPPAEKTRAVFTPAAWARLAQAGPACTAVFHYAEPPPSFAETDVSDKPEWVQALHGGDSSTAAHNQRQRAIVSALATDDAIGAFVQRLQEAGQLRNTVILYTSDNGVGWRDHHWSGKNCVYEGCARLPLVVRHPQPPAPGSRRHEFIMNVDLAPTIAALAGNPMPPTVPLNGRSANVNGQSFAGLLDGSDSRWDREEILLEVWGDQSTSTTSLMAAVRTTQWKYIEHYTNPEMTTLKIRHDGRQERELYDLVRDPYELDNLLLLSPPALQAKGYTRSQVLTIAHGLRLRLQALKAE